MRLHELQKQIEAGVAVRRKSWHPDYCIVKCDHHPAMYRRTPGKAQEIAGMWAEDLFADDWERADGLGRDTADAIEDRCDVMFTVAMLVKDAINHPGEPQVLEVITKGHLDRVVGYLESFEGIEYEQFDIAHEVHDLVFRVSICWNGDTPSKKQPPANFKRVHSGRDNASESGKEAS